MNVILNGERVRVEHANLAELLEDLDYPADAVATAVDGAFVARSMRRSTALVEDMAIEILAPIQGG